MIDEGRGSGALKKFFAQAFKGVLIHDFWGPYGSVLLGSGPGGGGEQSPRRLHLLHELDHVDEHALAGKGPDRSGKWCAFVKMLRRLLGDGIRLRQRKGFAPHHHASRIVRIDQRLTALSAAAYTDLDAKRLAKRLHHWQDSLFTFLDRPEADWNNNFAERQIRSAVILRKNPGVPGGNRSDRGAAAQAVLMSIHRTIRLRGHDPRAAIELALRAYTATGQLPLLPLPVAGG